MRRQRGGASWSGRYLLAPYFSIFVYVFVETAETPEVRENQMASGADSTEIFLFKL